MLREKKIPGFIAVSFIVESDVKMVQLLMFLKVSQVKVRFVAVYVELLRHLLHNYFLRSSNFSY